MDKTNQSIISIGKLAIEALPDGKEKNDIMEFIALLNKTAIEQSEELRRYRLYFKMLSSLLPQDREPIILSDGSYHIRNEYDGK